MKKEIKTNSTKSPDKSGEKNEFLRRKRKMVKFEKDNYNCIAFMRGMDGYWLAGGHSAVIYYNKIMPELGLCNTFRKDNDFEVRFPDGVISVKKIKKYKEKLVESKYIEPKVVEKPDGVVFKLKDALTPEMYEVLARSEEIRREKLLNLVSSSAVMPKTLMALRDVMKFAYNGVMKHSDKEVREYLTYRLIDYARLALVSFMKGCKSKQEFSECMNRVEVMLNNILVELYVIEASTAWEIGKTSNLSHAVTRALVSLFTERKSYERG